MNDNFSSLKQLDGDIVIDTGLLIEYFSKTKIGKLINDHIILDDSIINIFITDLTVSEIYYIFCRQKSASPAKQIIDDLLKWVKVIPIEDIRLIAADIKCKRSISLADCMSCAGSIILDIPVLFKSEQELIREEEKSEFDFDIYLLK